MIEPLDMRTMLQVGALSCLTLAVVMVYYSFARKTYPGFHHWTFGIVSSGVGAVLVSLRGFFPDFVSVFIGNLLVVTMPLMLAHGLSVFIGLKWRMKSVNLAFLLVFILVYLWGTYITPSLFVRIVFLCLYMAIFFGEALYLSIRHLRSVLDEQEWILIFFLFFSMLSSLFRLMVTVLHLETLAFLSLAGILHCTALLTTILGVVGSACSLLILNSHRMENDLKKANKKIEKQANQDGLTNLFNRRYFDNKLTQEFKRLQRNSQPISLILADIDHFKLYNDTYGHLAGDDCLKSIAAAFKETGGRISDIAARYGGEEFVMLLPNTDLEGARRVADAIKGNIASRAIPHATSTVSNLVTLSMGIATVRPDRSMAPELLVRLADQALYKSKGSGKDQIQVMPPEK